MKYIQKNETPPTDFHKWLIDNDKIIKEKIQAYEEGHIKRSEDVWSLFRSPEKDTFRTALLKEQGSICAYCGSIIGDNTHVRLDHVIPKALKIKHVFNYYNLVAACSGGEYIWHIVQKNETADFIAQKYNTDVLTIQRLNPNLRLETGRLTIQQLNPNLRFETDVSIEVKIAVVSRWAHCDVKKGDSQHDIKPTESDCQIKFGFSKSDGEIIPAELYAIQALQTIDVLGLNAPLLKEKRLKTLFKINAIVKNIQKIAPSKLKEAVIKEKQKIYAYPEKLPEMAFVAEYFWDSFLK